MIFSKWPNIGTIFEPLYGTCGPLILNKKFYIFLSYICKDIKKLETQSFTALDVVA
jgi:hypothetical protein